MLFRIPLTFFMFNEVQQNFCIAPHFSPSLPTQSLTQMLDSGRPSNPLNVGSWTELTLLLCSDSTNRNVYAKILYKWEVFIMTDQVLRCVIS